MRRPSRFLGALALAAAIAGPGAAAAPQALPAEAVRADLDALHAGLRQAHYDLYVHRTQAEHDQLHRVLVGSVTGPVERVRAEAMLQRFAAFGRVGHARVDAPVQSFVRHVSAGGRFLPLFIRVDEGRVRLTRRAAADGPFEPGVEVLSLEGEPIAVWLERVGAFVSSERPYMTHAQLEQAFPAVLWLAAGDVETATLEVRRASGETVRGTVRSVTLAESRALAARAPGPGVDFNAREFRMLEGGVGYLRPGPFAAAEGETLEGFRRFVDDSFRGLLAEGAQDLVLDLRNNGGGDNSFSDPIVAWFADRPFRFASSFRLKASPQAKAWYGKRLAAGDVDPIVAAMAAAEAAQPDGARYAFDLPLNPPGPEPRFHGKVYVLVNRHSYSNAASVAALIQDYGFGEVIGEETADPPTTYASVQQFALPSGILVTYPKSRIVRPSGDERLLGVQPDHPLPREPIAAPTDVVLDQAADLVRRLRPAAASFGRPSASRRSPGSPPP